ncbi:MAG TPA: ribosome maturation factor RimP [Desulfonatronum sp.]|nr:ribosome maturation factor RimP [Desulfonatronum sp.]
MHRLKALVLPVVHGLGLELWGMEFIPVGRKAIVRIYVEGEDGISVEQCAQVSRQLSPALEVEEILPGSFTLEVSSPGLERLFFSPEQLPAYLGHIVQVKLTEPVGDRKAFRGVLDGVEDAWITLDEDGTKVRLHWNQMKKIHLIYMSGHNNY